MSQKSVCGPCGSNFDQPIKEILGRAVKAAHEYDDTIQPVNDCEAIILDWDVSIMKRFMVEKGIYTAQEIDAAELEYKRWLNLNIMYRPLAVPISEKIDAFWHVHILFTQDYTAMSYAATGSYIHHRPSILDDANELKTSFAGNTLALYRAHYGEPNPVFWDNVMCTCQIGD